MPPADAPARGAAYWHEVIGVAVRGTDGEELGIVADIYRVGEADVYVVRGGARGEFDLPAVRDFIRIFAPKRGEIVVDARCPRARRPPRAPRRATPGRGARRRRRRPTPVAEPGG